MYSNATTIRRNNIVDVKNRWHRFSSASPVTVIVIKTSGNNRKTYKWTKSLNSMQDVKYTSSTHRRRRHDSAVELSRVGGVNAPVGSHDSVYNFLCCWAIEAGDKWRHNDVIVEKVINIDQNLRSQTAVFSFQIYDRIRRQSSWASCEYCTHTADADADATRLESWVASAVCIGH